MTKTFYVSITKGALSKRMHALSKGLKVVADTRFVLNDFLCYHRTRIRLIKLGWQLCIDVLLGFIDHGYYYY